MQFDAEHAGVFDRRAGLKRLAVNALPLTG